MAATLRHQASLSSSNSAHSPTSSTSSQNTTPTSPHFLHAQAAVPRYASTHPYAASFPHEARSTTSLSIHHPRPSTPPLLYPPSHQTFSAYLKTWKSKEVADFLALHRCGQYAAIFQRNDIDGKVILDLDMASLKEMGVSKVGERVKLLAGIKDLRKRAAVSTSVMSLSSRAHSQGVNAHRIELRLNGSATPDPDLLGPRSPDIRLPGERPIAQPHERNKRLNSSRPPPLDLQPHHSSRPLPQAYQQSQSHHSAQSLQSISQSSIPRPRITHTTSSSTTVTPASIPGPSKSNANLRAPPSREAIRRSPSPALTDATSFADRPLPPAPSLSASQSSAAEYANSITSQRNASDGGRSTPVDHRGLPANPAPSRSNPVNTVRGDHRKQPSLGTTPPKQISPIKNKYNQLISGRASTSGGPVHPFAANVSRDEKPPASASSTISSTHKRVPTSGYAAGSDGMLASSSSLRRGASQSQTQLPLEDIGRQVVKFTNWEDMSTRMVNVSMCTSGVEVLETVLKKFARWHLLDHSKIDEESDDEGDKLEIDGWGLYAESEPDDNDVPLSDANIIGFCSAKRDVREMREKGLVLKSKARPQHRKNMEVFFGEAPPPPMSPTSPIYMTGPRLGYQAPSADQDPNLLTPSKIGRTKKMNRASTVSIMSGLGVQMPDAPPSPSTARSPSSGSFLGIKRKPFYNFLGHRPPSELIANHLGEYFPAAKRKELEKSRNSMLRMSQAPNKRISFAPSENRGSFETDRKSVVSPPRRRSMRPSSKIGISSPPTAVIPEEGESETLESVPRVSVSSDGGKVVKPKIDGESDSESKSKPPLLPPFEVSKESLSEQLGHYSPTSKPRPKSIIQSRRMSSSSSRSRLSTLSQLRRNRDRTDTASMLTVDEITATVEQRRASTITFDESSDEEFLNIPPVIDPGLIPQNEVEEGSEADEEDLETETEESSTEEDTTDDEGDDSEEDDHGKAFTSSGSRIFKWIKGALIGAGSFGSVFLGMDAQSGLLMAVKQVELPTGSARNEERKRSMVDALEREIELLKELQHDNIVQYLDSSSDGNHLNIFLEYVPGGSVAALLNNYGAFEEPLVRNFCRQILTGLNYLHEREIIHRDIKGANILVDNKGGIKISDFGISKKVENNLMAGMKANRPSLQGSVFWMAPEIVKQTSYTPKADIWSVGCLVVEMLTGTHPWAELTQMQAIFRIGSQAPRPATPADISTEAVDFLDRSFEIDHNARSTALQLLSHAFIVPAKGNGLVISAQQAKNTMAQATKTREAMMGSMQGLTAMAESK